MPEPWPALVCPLLGFHCNQIGVRRVADICESLYEKLRERTVLKFCIVLDASFLLMVTFLFAFVFPGSLSMAWVGWLIGTPALISGNILVYTAACEKLRLSFVKAV